ncbi:MAG: hypothetical protein ABIJ56_15265 [Pseudomonadota bacterium]
MRYILAIMLLFTVFSPAARAGAGVIEEDLDFGGTSPVLLMSPDGIVHLVFLSASRLASYSRRDESGWNDPAVLPGTTSDPRFTRPSAAFLDTGPPAVLVVLRGSDGGEGWTKLEAAVGGTGGWTNEDVATAEEGGHYSVPAVGVSNGAAVAIAQFCPTMDCPNGFIRWFRREGADSWTDGGMLGPSAPPEQRDCAMASGPDGKVHAAWAAAGRSGYYMAYVEGEGWSELEEFDPRGAVSTVSFGGLSTLASGDPIRVFFGFPTLTFEFTRRAGAAGWTESVNIGSAGEGDDFDHYANVAAGESGSIMAVWALYNGSSGRAGTIQAAVNDGSGWTLSDLATDADVVNGSAPSVTSLGDTMAVIWRKHDGNFHFIQAAPDETPEEDEEEPASEAVEPPPDASIDSVIDTIADAPDTGPDPIDDPASDPAPDAADSTDALQDPGDTSTSSGCGCMVSR